MVLAVMDSSFFSFIVLFLFWSSFRKMLSSCQSSLFSPTHRAYKFVHLLLLNQSMQD
jgi:hypothetical protein